MRGTVRAQVFGQRIELHRQMAELTDTDCNNDAARAERRAAGQAETKTIAASIQPDHAIFLDMRHEAALECEAVCDELSIGHRETESGVGLTVRRTKMP